MRILPLIGFLLAQHTVYAQTGVTNSTSYSFGDSAGALVTPAGSAQVAFGYAVANPAASTPAPVMLGIVGYRSSGITVTESVNPAVNLSSSGRIYNVAGSTGAYFVNPNNQTVTVNFYFTDPGGTNLPGGSFTIAAGGEIADFFNELSSSSSSASTFTYTSSSPVAVSGLRFYTNERGDFLLSFIPVAVLPSTLSGVQILPHWVVEAQPNPPATETDRIVLINPTDQTITGSANFLLGTGAGASVVVGGTTGSVFPYSVSPRSSVEMVAFSATPTIQQGILFITPDSGSSPPLAFGIASSTSNGVTISQEVIPAAAPGTAFRIYADVGSPPSGGGISTFIIVVNPSASPVTVNFAVTTLSGLSIGQTTQTVGANQRSLFTLSSLGLPSTVPAILRVTSASNIVAAGLRLHSNERGDLLWSNVPAVPENVAVSTILPAVVIGGGFDTEVPLYNEAPGQSDSGILTFFSSTGGSLNIIRTKGGQLTSQ